MMLRKPVFRISNLMQLTTFALRCLSNAVIRLDEHFVFSFKIVIQVFTVKWVFALFVEKKQITSA